MKTNIHRLYYTCYISQRASPTRIRAEFCAPQLPSNSQFKSNKNVFICGRKKDSELLSQSVMEKNDEVLPF